ncbi:MAG: tryptophan synthase subunit alpha [Planctomycetota bacterium]
MTAISDLFERLRRDGRKALMPFVTAGDPDIGTTAAVIRALANAGADLCEVGIPYSDPIADGPVIQASFQRALDAGFKLRDAMELGTKLNDLAMPRVTMVSYAIIHRVGLDRYIDDAMSAGFSGAIVPDLLVEEADQMAHCCRQKGFDLIQLVTPTTPRERQVRIADSSSGFLYYVSVTGITGERRELPPDLVDSVAWLRERTELPICIGFGISGPDTAAQLAPVSDGLIVGSAIVRRIAGSGDQETAANSVAEFVQELRRAIEA